MKYIHYMNVVAIVILSFFTSSMSVATTINKTEHYKATFENGNVYDLTVSGNQFTWRGVSGTEKGKSQIITDYRHVNVADRVEVVQWVGQSGAFNTAVLDYDQLKIVSTGQHNKETWFWHGHLERLPV